MVATFPGSTGKPLHGKLPMCRRLRSPSFPYTVIDLVVMGRTAHLGTFGGPRRADHEAAMAALDKLGIASLAERIDTDIGRAKDSLH